MSITSEAKPMPFFLGTEIAFWGRGKVSMRKTSYGKKGNKRSIFGLAAPFSKLLLTSQKFKTLQSDFMPGQVELEHKVDKVGYRGWVHRRLTTNYHPHPPHEVCPGQGLMTG